MKGKTLEKRIALFASGNGTNVQRICEYFRSDDRIRPVVLFCNRPGAYVLRRASALGLPVVEIDKRKLDDPDFMLPVLEKYGVSHIVLAGFLALVPAYLTDAYRERILNIHPALLPKYGGKGMYGDNVHKAVVAAHERKSGITIHLVDEKYDNGKILFQAECDLAPDDDADAVAAKIHRLEQDHFPPVIRQWILSDEDNGSVSDRTRNARF